MGLSPAGYAALGLGTAGIYGANALVSGGGERRDRTLANTAGNLTGLAPGAAAGLIGGAAINPALAIPGAVIGSVAGALGGGYISDRVADMVDPSQGRISPTELLNTHLENDPIAQQAMYQEKIRQARLMQREQQRQQMLNYQAQMAQQQGA
jgi:hypothetical protein